MEPIKRKKIISEELVIGIFGNIQVLINISKNLLESLQVAVKLDTSVPDYENANVGAVLLQFCPFFKMLFCALLLSPRYSEYCKIQQKAIKAVHKLMKTSKFSSFCAACRKNPSCRGMDISVLFVSSF